MNDRQFYDQKAVRGEAELPPYLYTSMVMDKQLRHIYPQLYERKVVLDAGCGNGRLVRYFAGHGAKASIGMDISYQYMKSGLARNEVLVYNEKIKSGESAHSFFIHSSAEKMPVKDNCVETIIAFALLHHIPGKSSFIAECQRILVDGGHLVIVDPNGGHFLRNWINTLGRRVNFLTETETAINIEQLKEILKNFKFSVKQVKFESFFGDAAIHFSFVIFKKSRLLGRMIQYTTPFCLMIDSFLDATLFKVFPSLGWRYFLLSRKEQG